MLTEVRELYVSLGKLPEQYIETGNDHFDILTYSIFKLIFRSYSMLYKIFNPGKAVLLSNRY
jgi:hypothetical protein